MKEIKEILLETKMTSTVTNNVTVYRPRFFFPTQPNSKAPATSNPVVPAPSFLSSSSSFYYHRTEVSAGKNQKKQTLLSLYFK